MKRVNAGRRLNVAGPLFLAYGSAGLRGSIMATDITVTPPAGEAELADEIGAIRDGFLDGISPLRLLSRALSDMGDAVLSMNL